MITGEREFGDSAAQRSMAGGAPLDRRPVSDAVVWYRRSSFWRAVGGMVLAIALGCAAVALETAQARIAELHRHVDMLQSRSVRLRGQLIGAENQLAAMHVERIVNAQVNRVLAAPDVVVLRLAPSLGSKAYGSAAISRQAGSAIIEVAGLSHVSGQTCVMWWLPARGSASKAAELTAGPDGRLSRAVPMPPRGAKIAGAIITLETGSGHDQPRGRPILKGLLMRPQVLS